jgi:hypothetical protein
MQLVFKRIFFLKRFIAQKICTACSRTSYINFRLINLNKYLHNDTSETEVNLNIDENNGRENKEKKKHCEDDIIIP